MNSRLQHSGLRVKQAACGQTTVGLCLPADVQDLVPVPATGNAGRSCARRQPQLTAPREQHFFTRKRDQRVAVSRAGRQGPRRSRQVVQPCVRGRSLIGKVLLVVQQAQLQGCRGEQRVDTVQESGLPDSASGAAACTRARASLHCRALQGSAKLAPAWTPPPPYPRTGEEIPPWRGWSRRGRRCR